MTAVKHEVRIEEYSVWKKLTREWNVESWTIRAKYAMNISFTPTIWMMWRTFFHISFLKTVFDIF